MERGFRKGRAAIALSHDTPEVDRHAILPEYLHPEPGPKHAMEVIVEKRPGIITEFGFEEKDGFLSLSRGDGEIFGRLTGNARRVPGKLGMGIELAGKSEFDPALFPIDEELRLPNSNYTIAFWFKTAARNTRLCEARRYSSYNNRWSDHVVSVEDGKVRFQLQGDKPLETTERFNDGQWHQLVTTVGPGGQRLHVDGKLIATGKLTQRTRANNRLDVGPCGGNATVAIDEPKVFGHALDASEIAKLMELGRDQEQSVAAATGTRGEYVLPTSWARPSIDRQSTRRARRTRTSVARTDRLFDPLAGWHTGPRPTHCSTGCFRSPPRRFPCCA